MTDPLHRFVEAQQGVWEAALAELQAGEKRSHWMWFIFPQIAGLGRSPTAQFYAIADIGEATAYLAHDILGPRLVTASEAVLAHAGERSARAIMGDIDAVKLRSSMTLFERVTAAGPFGAVLNAFYDGERDPETLRRL
ncbi:MAG: calpastatin [Sphingomonas sp.]|nr:calpastatin [Sphingomonas sp.]|tara:strand:+ start:88 stop:501 length:414 start_codon:yes stop_codon:yes gene_type:complete